MCQVSVIYQLFCSFLVLAKLGSSSMRVKFDFLSAPPSVNVVPLEERKRDIKSIWLNVVFTTEHYSSFNPHADGG